MDPGHYVTSLSVVNERDPVPLKGVFHFTPLNGQVYVAFQIRLDHGASEVAAMEEKLLELYRDPAVDEKPELLAKRGGAFYSEAAMALLASLTADTGDTQVVNLRNNGTLPFLPDEAVIEVPATIGADGPVALPIAPVEPLYAGLIAHVTAYEELAVAAALHGGRDRVFQTMLAHPLIGQIDIANQLTDRLIAENHQHLSWAAP